MVAINNNVNNTIGASNSGVTNTLTVDNASNTGSSVAFVNATVGGGTAGDAYETFTVAGTTNWSQGVDNSDSDAYILAASTALGTTNVMRSTVAGITTYPLQTAFLVSLGVTTNQVGNSATPFLIIFNTSIADRNSDYNTGTGFLTAPVSGRYHLESSCRTSVLTSAMTYCTITLTASNRTLSGETINAGAMRTADGSNPNFIGTPVYALMDMDAADTCGVYITVNGGVSASASISTHFSGYLAC